MVGWNAEKGQWSTGPSSVHPPGMCKEVASIIVHSFENRGIPAQDFAGWSGIYPGTPKSTKEHLPRNSCETANEDIPRSSFDVEAEVVDNRVPLRLAKSKTSDKPKIAEHGHDFWLRVLRSRLEKKASLKEKEEPHWHTLIKEHDTSEEDEDGVTRPLLGEGVLGRGPPLTTLHNGARRGFS